MSRSDDERFMRVALETAQAKGSDPSVSPIGCCIVLDGKVIAAEANHVAEHRDATAHAEMEAIRAAGTGFDNGELRGATLYSTLQGVVSPNVPRLAPPLLASRSEAAAILRSRQNKERRRDEKAISLSHGAVRASIWPKVHLT